jgi:hypothetical protein
LTEALRETYSGNARSATDYGLKVIEISNFNTASAMDFFVQLLGTKSAADVVTLSAEQARKTVDTASAQGKDLWTLPRSLQPQPESHSRSISPRSFTEATKQQSIYIQVHSRGRFARLDQAPPRACPPMLDQVTGRCAMPPSQRTNKRRDPTGRLLFKTE